MKRQLFFIVLALIVFLVTLVSLQQKSEIVLTEDTTWFPFFLAEKLDPDSPANIGKLVLDAPAGKHGFVTAKDGHFYFEDGTRAKFWGTNLCFSACFPSKEQTEIMADRLAFFGFNAVRLHHMDFSFEPSGIFKDPCPECKNEQEKRTGILSEQQLDKLDYLIYQLKQRGIYIDMNLLVSRHFTQADGVIEAEKLGMAAKPASMFDPRLIELQKQYAKDLLAHYNPYTKMRYCDDPVIALVEITNENSMFSLERRNIPKYYLKQLDDKWDDFPKESYQTEKKAKTAFYIDIEKYYFKQMIDFLKNECNVKVPIAGIGGYWHSENIESQEYCDFIDTHSYWDHPRFPHRDWDKNDFRIHNRPMLLDKNLGIIGKITSRTPNPRTKPFTVTEWNHCYPNQYAYETPLILAGYAAKNNWDGIFQFAYSHGWKTNPQYDNIEDFLNIIANLQELILCSLGSYIFHNLDDLNLNIEKGIFRIDSSKVKGVVGFIKDKFITFKNFNMKSNQNGSIILYSPENKPIEEANKLILIIISEIKNTGSGWIKGKFNWGKAPTLLKHMNITITLSLNRNFKVYEINTLGKRGKEIETIFENSTLTFSTQHSNSPWFEIILE